MTSTNYTTQIFAIQYMYCMKSQPQYTLLASQASRKKSFTGKPRWLNLPHASTDGRSIQSSSVLGHMLTSTRYYCMWQNILFSVQGRLDHEALQWKLTRHDINLVQNTADSNSIFQSPSRVHNSSTHFPETTPLGSELQMIDKQRAFCGRLNFSNPFSRTYTWHSISDMVSCWHIILWAVTIQSRGDWYYSMNQRLAVIWTSCHCHELSMENTPNKMNGTKIYTKDFSKLSIKPPTANKFYHMN